MALYIGETYTTIWGQNTLLKACKTTKNVELQSFSTAEPYYIYILKKSSMTACGVSCFFT